LQSHSAVTGFVSEDEKFLYTDTVLQPNWIL